MEDILKARSVPANPERVDLRTTCPAVVDAPLKVPGRKSVVDPTASFAPIRSRRFPPRNVPGSPVAPPVEDDTKLSPYSRSATSSESAFGGSSADKGEVTTTAARMPPRRRNGTRLRAGASVVEQLHVQARRRYRGSVARIAELECVLLACLAPRLIGVIVFIGYTRYG